MAQPHASNTILFVSLFALIAATAVTGAALVSWNSSISERLTTQTDSSDGIPDTTVIGGVEGQDVYAYQTFAPPLIPYRAPNEALPSQISDLHAEQMAATASNDGVADLLAEAAAAPDAYEQDVPAVAGDPPLADIATADTSSADALATQTAILDTMRQTHVSVAAAF